MNADNKALTPLESLEVIQRMISRTKSGFSKEYSFYYLLWGWLLLAAAVLHYILLKTSLAMYSFLPWPVISAAGILTSIVYAKRHARKEKRRTYMSFFMQTFFSAGCVLFILGVFFCIAHDISPSPLLLLISGFYGIVYGRLLAFRPFVFGGVVFIGLSVISNFVLLETQLLLLAIGIVSGYLVPGYLLKSKYKELA